MALEVMLPYKTFTASVAPVLSVTKVSLDMRADVLSAAKHFAAVLVKTSPFLGCWVLLADIPLDLFWCDTRVF